MSPDTKCFIGQPTDKSRGLHPWARHCFMVVFYSRFDAVNRRRLGQRRCLHAPPSCSSLAEAEAASTQGAQTEQGTKSSFAASLRQRDATAAGSRCTPPSGMLTRQSWYTASLNFARFCPAPLLGSSDLASHERHSCTSAAANQGSPRAIL